MFLCNIYLQSDFRIKKYNWTRGKVFEVEMLLKILVTHANNYRSNM